MIQRLFAAIIMLVALCACGGGGGGTTNPPVPSPLPSASAAAAGFNDYATFGYDNARDVFNPNSTAITPASIANLHLGWQIGIGNGDDYNTQTQPILATEIPGHPGVLYVGGGGLGNEYGYDALTGTLVWSRALGVEQYSCSGSVGNFGVGGTAAYDPVTRSLYVIANANAQPNAAAKNTLVHLDAASGAVLGEVNFAASLLGPTDFNFSHTSVALSPSGIAYVGTGSTCDISSWRGRVVAIDVPAMTIAQTFFTVWNGTTQPWGGGGVWGWGGVSIDPSGNVLTGVGNADNGVSFHGSIQAPFVAAPAENAGNAEALLELSPGLALEASHHPIPANVYGSTPDAIDLDVNGTPVVFTPSGAGCDTLAALQSKSGSLYLYDTTKIGAGPIAQYQLAPPTYGDPFIGDPAYSPATGLLYVPVPVGSGSLYPPGMIAIDPGCGSPAVTWHTTFGPDSNINGDSDSRSVPAVSAGGVVFVGTPCQVTAAGTCTGSPTPASAQHTTLHARGLRKPAVCCAPAGSVVGGAVWALDASTGSVLNGGNPILTTPGALRMPPTVDGRWVFVIDNNGNMYGLTIDPSVPTAAAKMRSVRSPPRVPWEARPEPQT
jgi:hypothetical protein